MINTPYTPYKFILQGPLRIKKNSKRIICVWAKGRKRPMIVSSEAYLKWEKHARMHLRFQLPPGRFQLMTAPLWVKVLAFYKGSKPDLSGVLESVGDCLEGIVYENDRQIQSWDGSRLFHDKANPRTEIEVRIIS